jgi:hypothetical protein
VPKDCLNLEYAAARLSRNVGNCQSTLRNIPEERRCHLHHSGSLKSHNSSLRTHLRADSHTTNQTSKSFGCFREKTRSAYTVHKLLSVLSFHEPPPPPKRSGTGIPLVSCPLRHLSVFGQFRHMLSLCASHYCVACLRHFKLQHSLVPQIPVRVHSTTYAMPGSQSTICRIYTDTCTACCFYTQPKGSLQTSKSKNTYLHTTTANGNEFLSTLKPRKDVPQQVVTPSLSACCCISLLPSHAYINQPKVPVANRTPRRPDTNTESMLEGETEQLEKDTNVN